MYRWHQVGRILTYSSVFPHDIKNPESTSTYSYVCCHLFVTLSIWHLAAFLSDEQKPAAGTALFSLPNGHYHRLTIIFRRPDLIITFAYHLRCVDLVLNQFGTKLSVRRFCALVERRRRYFGSRLQQR